MKIFTFKASDDKGQIVNGKVASSDMEQVHKDVEKRGLKVISITEKTKWQDIFLSFSVKARDRSLLYRQLTTMLKAGVSITQAIEIARQTPNKSLGRVLEEMSLGLQNGFPLSRMMENYPQVFPSIETGVLRAGEATGKMEIVLNELSAEVATSASFTAKIRGAMVYPIVIVCVMIAVIFIVMTKVIPSISQIFEEQNLALPIQTQILIALSRFMTQYWYLIIMGIIFLVAGYKVFMISNTGKKTKSVISINFPVFGTLVREVFYARFNRTFSLLLLAGVPIIESVNILATITTNTIYIDLVLSISKSLEQGLPISSVLKKSKYFPPLMSQLLYVGQQTGDLSGMCDTLAEYYEEEVDNKLKTFTSLLEPFIFIVLGGGVGFVVISILGPIYSLVNAF
ncbi:MAG: type II secretion system F family protein [bacterium]|nr:type II secretion system F family protein [bacterium]